MERQYTKLDESRALVDGIIKGIEGEEDKGGSVCTPEGVGLLASLLALKRGYNRPWIKQAIGELTQVER